MSRALAVRVDAAGDVLLMGPAIRALARIPGTRVDVLASPAGEQAARLLPDVDDVLVHDAPWAGFTPPPVDPEATARLVAELAERGYDLAVIFTSFHQSPLPMALLARLAGIDRIAATCEDYPGSLLDVRHHRRPPPDGGHEVDAALTLSQAAGAPAPRGPRERRLSVRRPLPEPPQGVPGEPFVVVHPGASVSSRSLTGGHAAAIVEALRRDGRPVVVTGAPGEAALCAQAVGGRDGVVDLCGRTDLAQLAAVLDAADCVVVGNTGPAHLAAAVGTPVVSLFSPVVPVSRWAPYAVDVVVLGDAHAECRETRARGCPIPGHPCLSSVPPRQVAAAVAALTGTAPGRAPCAS